MLIPKFVPRDLDKQIAQANGKAPKNPGSGTGKRTAVRESQIEKYLVQRVKQLGGEVRKVKWLGRRGAPDRLVMLPLRWDEELDRFVDCTIWIELKAPGAQPEAYQVREHERMRKMGQRVEVVDSFARVDEVLS